MSCDLHYDAQSGAHAPRYPAPYTHARRPRSMPFIHGVRSEAVTLPTGTQSYHPDTGSVRQTRPLLLVR